MDEMTVEGSDGKEKGDGGIQADRAKLNIIRDAVASDVYWAAIDEAIDGFLSELTESEP